MLVCASIRYLVSKLPLQILREKQRDLDTKNEKKEE